MSTISTVGSGYPMGGWNSTVAKKPEVVVTPIGPFDGGDFGANTVIGGTATITGGVQEAINAVSDQAVIRLAPGVDATMGGTTTGNLSITKNLTLYTGLNGWPAPGATGGTQNMVRAGALSIVDTSEGIFNVRVQGIDFQSLTMTASTNYITGTSFDDCTFHEGVTLDSSVSDVVLDQTTFNRCHLEVDDTTTSGTATVTVLGSGSDNVNQTFFDNCFMELPYSVTAQAYLFLINGANFYPVVTGGQIHIAQSGLTMGTIFKIKNAASFLANANVKGSWTEFHSPCQIVEALTADFSGGLQCQIDWDTNFNNLVNGSKLINITATIETLSYVHLKGAIQGGQTVTNGTWTQGGSTMDVSINMPNSINRAFYMSVAQPAVPAGTGSGHTVLNPFTQKARIYPTSATLGAHIVDVMGNDEATDNASLTPIVLDPGEGVYFTTTAPTTWLWYGMVD